MQTFRNDPYRLCRNASFITGFFGSALPLWSLVNGHRYSEIAITLFALVVAAIPLAMYVYYRSAFIQFDGRTLVINNLLGKTSAPVEKIQAMAYKFVGTGLVLYLTYEDSGVMTKLVGVDFMSTGNIDAMNGDIKKLNPLIEVTADWLSKDQQKNNARYFRKPPTNVIGWLALVAGWLLGGVFTQFLLVTIFGLNK